MMTVPSLGLALIKIIALFREIGYLYYLLLSSLFLKCWLLKRSAFVAFIVHNVKTYITDISDFQEVSAVTKIIMIIKRMEKGEKVYHMIGYDNNLYS